jgi:hypothetical protein
MILGKATAKAESASNSFSRTCDAREEEEASLLSERRRPRRKAHHVRFPTHVMRDASSSGAYFSCMPAALRKSRQRLAT